MLGRAWKKHQAPPSFQFLWSQLLITELLSFKLGSSHTSPRSQGQKVTRESELSFPMNQVSNLHGCKGIFQKAVVKAANLGGGKKKTCDGEKIIQWETPQTNANWMFWSALFSMGVPERLCQDTWGGHRGLITIGQAEQPDAEWHWIR